MAAWHTEVDKIIEEVRWVVEKISPTYFIKRTSCKNEMDLLSYLEKNKDRLKVRVEKNPLCPSCHSSLVDKTDVCLVCGEELEEFDQDEFPMETLIALLD